MGRIDEPGIELTEALLMAGALRRADAGGPEGQTTLAPLPDNADD